MNPRLDKLFSFLEFNHNDTFILFAIATEYFSMNMPEKAIIYYEKVLNITPNYTGVYLHLSNALIANNQLFEAKSCLEKGLEICNAQNAHKDALELKAALLAFDE